MQEISHNTPNLFLILAWKSEKVSSHSIIVLKNVNIGLAESLGEATAAVNRPRGAEEEDEEVEN